jgi:hypothetical protein
VTKTVTAVLSVARFRTHRRARVAALARAGRRAGRPAAASGGGSCRPRPLPARPYLDVVAGGFPATTGLPSFAAAAAQLQLVSFYVRFGAAFKAPTACEIISHGAVPIIQIEPRTASVAATAAGTTAI